jgi:hypothetical protein
MTYYSTITDPQGTNAFTVCECCYDIEGLYGGKSGVGITRENEQQRHFKRHKVVAEAESEWIGKTTRHLLQCSDDWRLAA